MTLQPSNEDEGSRIDVAMLMERDISTVDVIVSMRNQGRSWQRIALCFRKQINEMKAM